MWLFATSLEQDMNQAEDMVTDHDPKTRAKMQQIKAAREAVFNAYMSEETPNERPTPGRFADPRAALNAGFSGR